MHRPIAIVAMILSASALSGCTAPHPLIHDGDANSVEVTYGGDVASALPLAQKHCAQYEKVPRLVDAGIDLATYDCVRR